MKKINKEDMSKVMAVASACIIVVEEGIRSGTTLGYAISALMVLLTATVYTVMYTYRISKRVSKIENEETLSRLIKDVDLLMFKEKYGRIHIIDSLITSDITVEVQVLVMYIDGESKLQKATLYSDKLSIFEEIPNKPSSYFIIDDIAYITIMDLYLYRLNLINGDVSLNETVENTEMLFGDDDVSINRSIEKIPKEFRFKFNVSFKTGSKTTVTKEFLNVGINSAATEEIRDYMMLSYKVQDIGDQKRLIYPIESKIRGLKSYILDTELETVSEYEY